MYVSSSAPIPQNSAMAPPPEEGQRANAGRLRNFMFSRNGRQRMYANLPTAASLAYLGLGLAADAGQAIAASESARQAILIGVGDSSNPSPFASTLEDLKQLIANAPTVLSLNGSSAVTPAGGVQSPVVSAQTGGQNSVMVPTMPQQAPRPVGGVYLNPAQPKGPVQPTRKVSTKQAGPPGCGLSGYPPPWSDAYLTVPQSAAPSGSVAGLPGWLVAAGLAVVGVVAISSRKRKGR